MKNKKLILEGSLVIVLFIMIALSLSLAWFSFSKETEVSDFTIDVASTDTFEISLDGVNYSRKLNIDVFNSPVTINGTQYNSSLSLQDLTTVLKENTSTNSTTYQSYVVYDPLRSEEDGSPITTADSTQDWVEAVGTKISRSGDKYYLISEDSSTLAQYIEFDLWIRSDSALDIYLGSESLIEPVTTTTDTTITPAMCSEIEYHTGCTVTTVKTNDPYLTLVELDDDTTNAIYYFSDTQDGTEVKHTFLVKLVNESYNNVNYTSYYDINGNKVASSEVKTENSTTYTYFYNNFVDKQFICKVDYDSNSGSPRYYDENSVSISKPDNLNATLDGYISLYNLANWSGSTSTQTYKEFQKQNFYDENYNFLICKITDSSGVDHYYDKDINYSDDTLPAEVSVSKPYKVISESMYGEVDKSYLDTDCLILMESKSYTFSKNLACGAAVVSLSEMVTDTFSDGIKEVENFKYLWNPLLQYRASAASDGASTKYYVDKTRTTETINYYSLLNNVYTLQSFNNSNVRNGAIETTDSDVSTNEIPIVSTTKESNGVFCVKKIRIKLWLDGNDELATNSMLNASNAGNGKFNIKFNFVASVNKTIVSCQQLVDDVTGYYIDKQYQMTATKTNKDTSYTYTWSVDGSWTNSNGDVFAIATIDQNGLLTFNQYGTVIVYAKDKDDRLGSCVVTCDYVRLKSVDETEKNKYTVLAIKDFYTDANVTAFDAKSSTDYLISDDFSWSISDSTIATLTTNSTTKQAEVTFLKTGTVTITFMTVKTYLTTNPTTYHQEEIEYTIYKTITISHIFEN